MAAQVERLKQRGVSPALAIVRVGQRPEDLSYERGALKRCEMVGITVKQFILPDTVELTELLHIVEAINQDAAIHGCLLFRPLPRHLDEAAVCAALAPSKDVDGITDGSLAGVFAGSGSGFPPCTAQACLEILDYYGYELTGKRAVVVGRSLVIGKPAAMLLLQRNATVTLCHTRTADLAAECRRPTCSSRRPGKPGCWAYPISPPVRRSSTLASTWMRMGCWWATWTLLLQNRWRTPSRLSPAALAR